MYVPDLASLLNLNEIKTKYGAKYKGGQYIHINKIGV